METHKQNVINVTNWDTLPVIAVVTLLGKFVGMRDIMSQSATLTGEWDTRSETVGLHEHRIVHEYENHPKNMQDPTENEMIIPVNPLTDSSLRKRHIEQASQNIPRNRSYGKCN